jgi:hypothetical protein
MMVLIENFIRTHFHYFCKLMLLVYVLLTAYLRSAFQIEIDGQILGKGVGATWEEAKLQVVS